MEQNKFDEQLKNYFQQNKSELTDAEFTKRVMQKLSRKTTPYYIVYLFLAFGILLFLAFNGFDQAVISFNDLTITIPELKLSSVQSLSMVIVFVLIVLSVSVLGIDSEDSFLSI
jgi:amino acid transporter